MTGFDKNCGLSTSHHSMQILELPLLVFEKTAMDSQLLVCVLWILNFGLPPLILSEVGTKWCIQTCTFKICKVFCFSSGGVGPQPLPGAHRPGAALHLGLQRQRAAGQWQLEQPVQPHQDHGRQGEVRAPWADTFPFPVWLSPSCFLSWFHPPAPAPPPHPVCTSLAPLISFSCSNRKLQQMTRGGLFQPAFAGNE